MWIAQVLIAQVIDEAQATRVEARSQKQLLMTYPLSILYPERSSCPEQQSWQLQVTSFSGLMQVLKMLLLTLIEDRVHRQSLVQRVGDRLVGLIRESVAGSE